MKYLWAAYRNGAMKELGIPLGLSAPDFDAQFKYLVLNNFDAVWVGFGPTKKGQLPIGVVFASWARGFHHMIVAGVVIMPWASKRNIIEMGVSFLNDIRRELQLVIYAVGEHRHLYEVACKHGVLRRVGTSYTAIPNQAAAVFETRER